MIDLTPYRPKLIELCHALAVRRLELVGSAAREDFRSESSDIDVLIEFEGNQSLFNRYFDLKFGLEKIFGRKVDVIENKAVKNPHLRKSLDEDRIALYEA